MALRAYRRLSIIEFWRGFLHQSHAQGKLSQPKWPKKKRQRKKSRRWMPLPADPAAAPKASRSRSCASVSAQQNERGPAAKMSNIFTADPNRFIPAGANGGVPGPPNGGGMFGMIASNGLLPPPMPPAPPIQLDTYIPPGASRPRRKTSWHEFEGVKRELSPYFLSRRTFFFPPRLGISRCLRRQRS